MWNFKLPSVKLSHTKKNAPDARLCSQLSNQSPKELTAEVEGFAEEVAIKDAVAEDPSLMLSADNSATQALATLVLCKRY